MSKNKVATTSNKGQLLPARMDALKAYAAGVGLKEGTPAFLNDAYGAFEQMVLSLPACGALSSSDVIEIALEPVIELFGQRRKLVAEGHDPVPDLTPELVRRLTEFLESLPRPYVLRFTLPGMPALKPDKLRLAEDVALCLAPEGNAVTTPAPRVQNLLAEALLGDAAQATMLLEIEVQGFASTTLTSPGMVDGLALAKQCAFLLDYAGVTKNAAFPKDATRLILVDRTAGTERQVDLSESVARRFGALTLNEDGLVLFKPGGGLLQGVVKPSSDEERKQALAERMAPLSRLFANRHRPGFTRVAAAIEWHEDSIISEDQTLAYLAGCIGLESIFGEEKSEMSEMSARLGDRYAFMLGKDREDRARLIHEFRLVLKTRGELVHARAKRLTGKDQDRLATVRRMLKDSINHELERYAALQ